MRGGYGPLCVLVFFLERMNKTQYFFCVVPFFVCLLCMIAFLMTFVLPRFLFPSYKEALACMNEFKHVSTRLQGKQVIQVSEVRPISFYTSIYRTISFSVFPSLTLRQAQFGKTAVPAAVHAVQPPQKVKRAQFRPPSPPTGADIQS